MEVVLRDHVENVGNRGEVVKVADGFARNFLLPRKLALLATPGNVKQVQRERVKLDAKEAEEKTSAEAIAARMSSIVVAISRRVGETEVLYGSVTSADIAESLKQGFDIDRGRSACASPSRSSGGDGACEAALSGRRPGASQVVPKGSGAHRARAGGGG
jgi:large subunit ribosomal protein L9